MCSTSLLLTKQPVRKPPYTCLVNDPNFATGLPGAPREIANAAKLGQPLGKRRIRLPRRCFVLLLALYYICATRLAGASPSTGLSSPDCERSLPPWPQTWSLAAPLRYLPWKAGGKKKFRRFPLLAVRRRQLLPSLGEMAEGGISTGTIFIPLPSPEENPVVVPVVLPTTYTWKWPPWH